MIIKIAEAFMRVERVIYDKQPETDVYNDAFLNSLVTYFKLQHLSQVSQVRRSYKLFQLLLNIWIFLKFWKSASETVNKFLSP